MYTQYERGKVMATAPTQIRIDADVKKEASVLFDKLGLDMSSAVNMFLHQCIIRGGLPFAVEIPQYSQKTIAAMKRELLKPQNVSKQKSPKIPPKKSKLQRLKN